MLRTLISLLLPMALLSSFATSVSGEPAPCVLSSAPITEDESLPDCEQLYPPAQFDTQDSPWRIGLGAGYGERSNPMINSDDVPIYGILQLSYFGERFFFDNGDLGWLLGEGDNWTVNAVAGVGGERSFFSFLNEGSIGFNPGLSGALEGDSPDTTEPLLEREIEAPERDYTVDGGLELLYRRGPSEFQLQLLTDLSGRHKGQEIWASWGLPQVHGRWEFAPSLGVTWKSSDAANYYYGVRDDEAQPGLPAYEVGSALNPFVRLALSYRLNAHWKVVSIWQYEHLADTIQDSPSVEDDYIGTGFVGLYYEF